jgi:HEAT repeat protein
LSESTGAPDDDALPVGIVTVDRSLVVRTWSSWLESVTGIPEADVRGRSLIEVIPDLQPRGLLARFERVLESGEVQVLAPAFHHYLIPCPPRPVSPNFEHMQQLVTLGALREGDAVVGVMATIEDVTGRLDAERALAADLRSPDPVVRERASGRLAEAHDLQQPGAFTEALREGDWRVRRTAVHALTRHASKDLLASLITALRDEHHDFNVLSSALQLLSMVDVEVTAPLAELLKDPNPDVRIQAALALGEQPPQAATPALLGALEDADVNVRFHAIEALGRLRAPEAVGPLAALAESRDFFLAFAAIDALVRIADPGVVLRLLPLLQDDTLAGPVAEALGSLGGGEVVMPLTHVLDRPEAPVASIVRALASLYSAYETRYGGGAYIISEFQAALSPTGAALILEAIPQASRDELKGLVLVLGWLDGPAVARALTQLLGRPDLRAEVIEALVRQGASVVDVLLDHLKAEDHDVQLAAIVALGRLGDARATVPLCGILHNNGALTVAAAGALASIGDQRAFEPLLALLGHDDSAVRQAAIGALNSLGHPDMARHVQALLGSPETATRESAVRIAGYFGYPDCAAAVFAACGDADESVRRAALEHAPLFDERQALGLLTHAVRHDTPRARASAATALGRVEGESARLALHEALGDRDAWVRYFAARALAQHRQPDSLEPLATLTGTDPAPHVRLAALETIGVIDGPLAAGLLASHTEDSTPEVAAAALAALGHVKDEAAMVPLERALRSADPLRRAAAARALTTRGGAGSVDALRWTASADTDEDVARLAVEGMARLAASSAADGPGAIDALVELTADARQREIAIATLARASTGYLDRVARGLAHPAPDVRRATVDVLTRMKHADAVARVRGALDNDHPDVREAAVTALDRVGARGLSRKLAAMAQGDPDQAVRRAAVAVLSRTSGPEGDRGARD